MRHIVWTRSQQDWVKDEQVLKAAKAPYVHLPCIKVQPRTVTSPTDFNVAVLTSPKAAQILLANSKVKEALKKADIYVFGALTYEVLEQAGLAVKRIDAKTAKDMSQSLKSHLGESHKIIVYQAAKPAFDIVADLVGAGLQAEAVILYDTIADLVLSEEEASRLRSAPQNILCFASPSAVEAFVQAVGEGPLPWKVATIGETTAQSARTYFSKVYVAEKLGINGLVGLAADLLASDY